MSQLDTIFFDWGGVIADDPGDEFLTLLLKQRGASDEQADEIYNGYMRQFMRGELSESDYWDILRDKYNLGIEDTISEEFKKWNGLIVNEQIIALVDQAKSQNLQVAVLTNIIEPTYNVLVEGGCYDQFDTVIASCKVGFAKPQSEIYTLALDKMNTTADRSLFIDDKQRNIEPAAQMGFETILARNPEQIIRDINTYLNA